MKIEINLHGGLDVLFGGNALFSVEVEDGANMARLIEELKLKHLKEREELFI